MLGKSERKVCQRIMGYGEIISQEPYICEGIKITHYWVKYEGCIYEITMEDSKYVFCHRLTDKEEVWES